MSTLNKPITTLEQARREAGLWVVASGCDDARTLADFRWTLQIELDLIGEGQEAAECYTPRQVAAMRKFLARIPSEVVEQ